MGVLTNPINILFLKEEPYGLMVLEIRESFSSYYTFRKLEWQYIYIVM